MLACLLSFNTFSKTAPNSLIVQIVYNIIIAWESLAHYSFKSSSSSGGLHYLIADWMDSKAST